MITFLNTDFGNQPVADQAWFNEVKRLGHRGLGTSVNRWNSTEFWPMAGVIVDRTLTAGLVPFVYCRLPEGWENGLKGLGTLAAKLSWFEADVEPETGIHPVTDAHLEGLVKSGQRAAIYTNAGMWAPSMGYDPGVHFAAWPLHDRGIRATTPTGMKQAPLVTFGGWNTQHYMRRIWQCRDGIDVAGVACDLNVVDGRWL